MQVHTEHSDSFPERTHLSFLFLSLLHFKNKLRDDPRVTLPRKNQGIFLDFCFIP